MTMKYISNGFEFYGVSKNDNECPNNILVTDASGKRMCFVRARYKYVEKATIILEDGHNFHPNDANGHYVQSAIEALQLVYGPDLPVHNNLELAGRLGKYEPKAHFACGPIAGTQAVYGETFPWLTTSQAAERLGVNASRIRQLIDAGRIKATKFGKAWMIEESELDGYERGKGGRPRRSPDTLGPQD